MTGTDRAPLGSADARLTTHARFGPVAALVIATLVRFHGLGTRSLWTDEGSTWTAAALPLHAMLRRCVERDASPPLYYLLTSWALKLGGDEAHLRLVSVLASLGLVVLTYRLARLGLGRNASTFAALICALSPFQVMYAQEARTYTLVAMLLVTAVYAYARLLAGGSRRGWWLLVGATTLGLWTQSIALLGAATQGVLAVLTPEGRKRFLPWIGALAAAAVLYLPWAWYGRGLGEHLSSSHWYIPDPDARSAFKVIRAAVLSPMSLVAAPAGSAVPGLNHWMPSKLAWVLVSLPPVIALAMTLPMLFSRTRRGLPTRVGWAGWLAPVGVVFLASLVRPLFMVRYFVFMTPFVAVLYAVGLSRIRNRPVRVVLASLLLALSLFGLMRYEHDYTKEPWRTVTQAVAALHQAPRTAVLVPFDVDPFAYYDRRMGGPVTAFEVGHPDEPFAAHYTPRELVEMDAAARRNVASFDEVWVVVRSPNSDIRREVARRTNAVAAEGRHLALQTRYESLTGGIGVWRYVRDSLATR